MHSAETLSKADLTALREIFKDEKIAKQVLNAAKRVSKKREASTDSAAASSSKKMKEAKITKDSTPFEIESSLALPTSSLSESELLALNLVSNRAPLVLAFAVSVLKYTMPEQPISSRLSLAQAVVSANSRNKAVSLGLESEQSAEQAGWGEGHPVTKVLGREIRVMKRWDYDPREGEPTSSAPEDSRSNACSTEDFLGNSDDGGQTDKLPPLWGIDLEALRKTHGYGTGSASNPISSLPIFTAESARSYLLRSISRPQANQAPSRRSTATPEKEREDCVGQLLHAIDLVCRSWASTLDRDELDKRAWAWYLRVRPDVQSGAQGWGEKGQIRLSDILDLRRDV